MYSIREIVEGIVKEGKWSLTDKCVRCVKYPQEPNSMHCEHCRWFFKQRYGKKEDA